MNKYLIIILFFSNINTYSLTPPSFITVIQEDKNHEMLQEAISLSNHLKYLLRKVFRYYLRLNSVINKLNSNLPSDSIEKIQMKCDCISFVIVLTKVSRWLKSLPMDHFLIGNIDPLMSDDDFELLITDLNTAVSEAESYASFLRSCLRKSGHSHLQIYNIKQITSLKPNLTSRSS